MQLLEVVQSAESLRRLLEAIADDEIAATDDQRQRLEGAYRSMVELVEQGVGS